MLGHGAGIGYRPRPPDGPIDNFSLVTGSPPDRPPLGPAAADRPRALQTTTDVSVQNNTGPLGGPVIILLLYRKTRRVEAEKLRSFVSL